jgi:hypothetical protein
MLAARAIFRTRHVQRRPSFYFGTFFFLATLLSLAFMCPPEEKTNAPKPQAERVGGTQRNMVADWAHHEGGAYRLSYPGAWELEAMPAQEFGESYRLHIPSPRANTILTVERQSLHGSPSALRRWMVREVMANPEYVRTYLRQLPSSRTESGLVARLHYVAERASGEQVRGVKLALAGSDEHTGEEHTYVLDLQTSGNERVLRTNEALCLKMLEGLAEPEEQAQSKT